MTRLHQETLKGTIKDILEYSGATKKRKFLESIELQIRLKGYTQKDKRFIGAIKLPNVIRPGLRIGFIGNADHCEQAGLIGTRCYDMTALGAFNKEKKVIKSWARRHHLFLASENVIMTLNKTLGPTFARTGKFPAPVRVSTTVAEAVDDVRKTAKFRLKKSIAFGIPVANVGMTEEQVYQNVMILTNYIVSLLKKQWQSVGAIRLHSTMGKPHRVF